MYSLRTAASTALILALVATAGAPAAAAPEPGQAFPALTLRDVTDAAHHTDELRGQPSIVVVVTDPHAQANTRRWVDTAEARVRGRGARVVTIVALDLSHMVPSGVVRDRALRQTPGERQHRTWLDVHGAAQQRLGLDDGTRVPWVFALDAQGQVRAAAHAPVDAPDAARVFDAIR